MGFRQAKQHASNMSSIGFDDCVYSVGTVAENHLLVAWVFYLKRNNVCLETIRVDLDTDAQPA